MPDEPDSTAKPTLNDLMDGLGWSEDYRRGVTSAWPEIERLRDVLRAIRDFRSVSGHPDHLSHGMRKIAVEGLQGE